MARLIVAGGGTGGHVLAGVAIADAWKETFKDRNPEVLFVGASGGIEERLVPRAGYPLRTLKLGALNRVSGARKIKTALQLPLSMLRSALLLIQTRPKAVIGVGGYSSGPLVLMARLLGWMWGARVAILEQNAVPGFTNRILGRVSHKVLSAFPGVDSQFPGKQVLVTGNPVRESIRPFPRASRDPFTIFIFGGSQGAVGINSLVIGALPHLGEALKRIRLIHQTGERDFERVRQAHDRAGTSARVEKFIYDMPEVYAAASLLICRAGSSTLAEVAAARRASILIPFPQAADNHQEKNARIFADSGAAKILTQAGSNGEDLAREILELMRHPERIDAMEEAVGKFYRPRAAQDVVTALTH